MINPYNEEALFELLTLTCEVTNDGNTIYRNKDGHRHRIYGPAVIRYWGAEEWYRNDKLHREDGPAIFLDGINNGFWVNGNNLTKEQFIKWQKDNGIKSVK